MMKKMYHDNRQAYNDLSDLVQSLVEKYRDKMKELFKHSDTSGSTQEYRAEDGSTYQTTYGEMTCDGVGILLKFIENNNIRFFSDVGCGCGKIPIMIGSAKCIRLSHGVELVGSRYSVAQKILNELEDIDKNKTILGKIRIDNMDMFSDKFNFKDLAQNDKSLVFISNLCFSQDVTNRLFKRLSEELPNESYIVSSQIPSAENMKKYNLYPVDDPTHNITNGTTTIPMTWNSGSSVYFYQIKQ